MAGTPCKVGVNEPTAILDNRQVTRIAELEHENAVLRAWQERALPIMEGLAANARTYGMSGLLHCRECGVVGHDPLPHRTGCLAALARELLASEGASAGDDRHRAVRRAMEALQRLAGYLTHPDAIRMQPGDNLRRADLLRGIADDLSATQPSKAKAAEERMQIVFMLVQGGGEEVLEEQVPRSLALSRKVYWEATFSGAVGGVVVIRPQP
jgi:hypothetical protein